MPTACWWQYSTPDTSCWNMTRACFVKRASSRGFVKGFVKGIGEETEGSSARGSGQRLRVQWPGLSRGEWAEAQGHPARPEEAAEAELATEGWCFRMPMRRAPWAPIAFRWRR